MYRRNKSSPRTEPCGTPHKVVSVSDTTLLTSVIIKECIYSLRNFRSQFAPNGGEIFVKNVAYFLWVTSWNLIRIWANKYLDFDGIGAQEYLTSILETH